MILVISAVAILIAIGLVLLEMRSRGLRNKRLNQYIVKNQPLAPVPSNRILIGFAKESRKELEQKLLDAGYHNKNLARYYFPAKLAVVVMVGIGIMMSSMLLQDKLVMMLAATVLTILVPDMLLEMKRRYMVRRISRGLPYLLDMMAVCVQTGMTIEATFSYLHKELYVFDKNLCYQIKKTSDASKFWDLKRRSTI